MVLNKKFTWGGASAANQYEGGYDKGDWSSFFFLLFSFVSLYLLFPYSFSLTFPFIRPPLHLLPPIFILGARSA